jgi:hypothetical protein
MSNGIVSSITRAGTFEPFPLQVARGQISGHTSFTLYAYSASVGSTAYGPIWEGLTQSGGLYTFPSSAAQLTIVSTSVSDTSALSVIILGLDANFNQISETIALNGTTAVTSVNSYLRVNGAYVANGTNVGAISFKQSTNLLAQINAGVGTTEMGIYTVPNGYSLYVTKTSKTANIGFTSSAWMNFQIQYNFNPTGQVFLGNQQTFVQQLVQDYSGMPHVIPQKTDIQALIKSSTGGPMIAQFEMDGILIQNNVLTTQPGQ